MKKADFLKEVLLELDTIKERATREEINKLNFRRFIYDSSFSCIYGQMTGSCNSIRASELMRKSYCNVQKTDSKEFGRAMHPFSEQDFSKGFSFTALEKYLFMVEAPVHEQIINYLKGLTSEITLR